MFTPRVKAALIQLFFDFLGGLTTGKLHISNYNHNAEKLIAADVVRFVKHRITKMDFNKKYQNVRSDECVETLKTVSVGHLSDQMLKNWIITIQELSSKVQGVSDGKRWAQLLCVDHGLGDELIHMRAEMVAMDAYLSQGGNTGTGTDQEQYDRADIMGVAYFEEQDRLRDFMTTVEIAEDNELRLRTQRGLYEKLWEGLDLD